MDQTVTLKLNVQMLNIVLTGLAKLPLEMSMETFDFVRKEAEKQLGPATQQPAPSGPLANKVIN
jgi:hypothetical protein